MSLIRRKLTPKMLAANRVNALKSTGPRTEQGIASTSQNIMKSLPFPPTFMANMRELGENPAEYEALCQALYRTLDPQDDFEQMLVEDMAQARWRRQRLIRAESGVAASQRRKYEIDRELQKYDRGDPYERITRLAAVPKFGFSGMPASLEKCDIMLKLLGEIRNGVLVRGFNKADATLFQMAYGESVAADNANLKIRYQTCLESVQSDDPEHERELRKAFVTQVEGEIAAYEKLKELVTARDVETTPAMKDAQLLPHADQLEAIARYDAGLERQFENKVKLLVAWRSARHAAGPAGRIAEGAELPAQTGKRG